MWLGKCDSKFAEITQSASWPRSAICAMSEGDTQLSSRSFMRFRC